MQHLLRPVAYGLGLTVLWLVLAAANDSTTYHLAPLLIAAAVPIGTALTQNPSPARVTAAALIGIGFVYSTTALLGSTDRLTGPSLLPVGGAVLEAVVFGAAGALAGLGFAAARHR